jgi:hypothetical protein
MFMNDDTLIQPAVEFSSLFWLLQLRPGFNRARSMVGYQQAKPPYQFDYGHTVAIVFLFAQRDVIGVPSPFCKRIRDHSVRRIWHTENIRSSYSNQSLWLPCENTYSVLELQRYYL